MIPIERLPLPSDIEQQMLQLTEQIRSEAPGEPRKRRAAALWESRKVRQTVYTPIRTALSAMAPGIDGCMYCGNYLGGDVDHFEPKSINPLRTFCWHNHLLACSECNSTSKGSRFPVDGLYQPLLIDPTVDNPFDHLHLVLSNGEYTALTRKGRCTLDVLRLNDSKRRLPEARMKALRQTRILLSSWHDANVRGDDEEQRDIAAAIKEQPFADVCQAALRLAEHPDADLLFCALPEMLTLLRKPQLRSALLPTPRVHDGERYQAAHAVVHLGSQH